MSSGQRIRNVLLGLVTLLLCVVLIVNPEEGFPVIALVLSVSLVLFGARELVYYFSMARHMVGGKTSLYLGVIVLDLGMFALALDNMPQIYIVLYLLGVHAFSGVIDIMRSREAKRMGASSWRLNMASGAVNIVISAMCVIFLRSPNMIVYIYAAGLIWSACVRIVNACRKTAVVYIQ